MATELYILKLRLISRLRLVKELGILRIVIGLVLITALYKHLLNSNGTIFGAAAVVILNLSLTVSVHLSRKDGFFLDLLCINKKFLLSGEYFIYSVPFISVLVFSQFYFLIPVIFLFIAVIVNIKSGGAFNLKIFSGSSFLPAYAFELISGIRKNIFFVSLIYLGGIVLCFEPVAGIMCVLLLSLIFSSFFTENEPLLMIEAFSLEKGNFIRTKIFQSLKFFLLIISPVIILHLIFYYERWYLMGGVVVLGLSILTSAVLTKYAFYTEEFSNAKMNYIITSIVIFSFVSSFFMTGAILLPLPFLMMIYLYKKAANNMESIRFISFSQIRV